MKNSLFARLQSPFNGCSFDIVVEVTGQKVGQHHGGQQVDGVAWLTVYLLATPSIPFGGLLLWVVFLLYHHRKPAGCREAAADDKRHTTYHDNVSGLPEAGLEVCRLTLPLTAAELSRALHVGPVDGNLAEEQPKTFRPSLQPPRGEVEGDR